MVDIDIWKFDPGHGTGLIDPNPDHCQECDCVIPFTMDAVTGQKIGSIVCVPCGKRLGLIW